MEMALLYVDYKLSPWYLVLTFKSSMTISIKLVVKEALMLPTNFTKKLENM